MYIKDSFLHQPGKRYFNLEEYGVRGVPRIGIHQIQKALPPLPVHNHPNCLEICHLIAGQQSYRVGENVFDLKANDIFWFRPGQSHQSETSYHGKGLLFWIQIKIPERSNQSILGLDLKTSRYLVKRLLNLPNGNFVGTQKLKHAFEEIWNQIDETDNTLVDPWVLSVAVQGWLSILFMCLKNNKNAVNDEKVRRIQTMIRKNLYESPSVSELADQVNLSESHLRLIFKQTTGQNLSEYIGLERMKLAQKLVMTTQKSITGIAAELNFSSSQYFSTVYRNHFRTTPSEARARQMKVDV